MCHSLADVQFKLHAFRLCERILRRELDFGLNDGEQREHKTENRAVNSCATTPIKVLTSRSELKM